MSSVSAAQVMELRKKTDLPMMDCKAALIEANGDGAAAMDILNKKFRGKFDTKSDRETTEGVIGIFIDPHAKSAGMIELRCETAQVAKTEVFTGLARDLARITAAQSEAEPSPDTIKAAKLPDEPSKTIKDFFGEVFGKLGENMVLARCRRITGEYLAEYVHHNGKVGAVVALNATPSPESVGRDLCQHIAFARPLAIERKGLPADKIESVRATARAEALEMGKPEKIVDKIADGKVNAWCAQRCLEEHEHVKVPKTKVADVLKQAGVDRVTDLAVFELGA